METSVSANIENFIRSFVCTPVKKYSYDEDIPEVVENGFLVPAGRRKLSVVFAKYLGIAKWLMNIQKIRFNKPMYIVSANIEPFKRYHSAKAGVGNGELGETFTCWGENDFHGQMNETMWCARVNDI